MQAVNQAPDPSEWGAWSTSEVPAGKPDAPGAPTATRASSEIAPDGGQVGVSWKAPADNGDAVKTYHVDVLKNGSKVETRPVSGTSTTFEGLDTKAKYTFAVTAENKAGKGSKSAASSAVTPYGKPKAPGTPSASVGKGMSGQAKVSWGAADDNGAAVTYTVATDKGGSKTSTGTSMTYSGLSNGTAYKFRVQACNAGGCSGWTSYTGAVTPFGAVPAPTVSASGGDQKVAFSWNTSTNGRGISVKVSGAVSSTAKSGSKTVSASYSQSKEICVTATDTEGQSSKKCASDKADPKPQPVFTLSKGNPAVGESQYGPCNHSSCAYLRLTVKDAKPNTTFTYSCMARGEKFNSAGTNWANSPTERTRTDANGNAGPRDLWCYWGGPGANVQVQTSIGNSNTITW